MSNNPQDLISIVEVTIPFYEDKLIVQLGEDGEIYVALRPSYMLWVYPEDRS